MRKTKIICTIGPSCDNEETLTSMCKEGMDVARLNFSHGTHEEHQEKIDLIKRVREKLNIPLAILLDTKGPEYRIRDFANGKEELIDGQEFTFTVDEVVGDNHRVSVNYKNLPQELNTGDTILCNDGLLVFEVTKLTDTDVKCKVITGGEISNHKSMSFPGHVFKVEYLSEQDKSDILFGIKNDIDFVAASFVSNKENVADLRKFLDENGGEDIEIIAKIENQSGVDNVDKICEVADGIMVARGDLGVEIPFVEVPTVQKYIINKCRLLGKRVITATEMLESMIHNPRPTRAEISDVANAVYDGSSAIMLSGESAAGKYPVESVKAMADIAKYTEDNIDYEDRFRKLNYVIENSIDALSHATCSMAIDVGAKGIVISSMSGLTVKMVSRFRCPVDVIGLTTSAKALRQLNLSWGVKPMLSEEYDYVDVMFDHAVNSAKNELGLNAGDNIVLTGGSTSGKSGHSNTIRIETVK